MYGSYVASRLVEKQMPIMYTDRMKTVFVYERIKIKPLYDSRGKPSGYQVERLKDAPVKNWYSDVKQDMYEYTQVKLE